NSATLFLKASNIKHAFLICSNISTSIEGIGKGGKLSHEEKKTLKNIKATIKNIESNISTLDDSMSRVVTNLSFTSGQSPSQEKALNSTKELIKNIKTSIEKLKKTTDDAISPHIPTASFVDKLCKGILQKRTLLSATLSDKLCEGVLGKGSSAILRGGVSLAHRSTRNLDKQGAHNLSWNLQDSVRNLQASINPKTTSHSAVQKAFIKKQKSILKAIKSYLEEVPNMKNLTVTDRKDLKGHLDNLYSYTKQLDIAKLSTINSKYTSQHLFDLLVNPKS
ncbi:MAG: hypothetical protein V4489_09410, partial [Chlamydiota bacterium]